MIGVFGIVIVFAMVFGGYLAAGGKFGIILGSIVYEMIIIGGAAVGAFVIANSASGIKQTVRDVGMVFKGPKWKAQDYEDLLVLMFTLIRISR
ncbi:MAG: motility-associated protein, partial [Pseudomonadota bacterium]